VKSEQNLTDSDDEIINALIVGMTGVGKSTYINAIVNYFMGIEMDDDFRYVISEDMFRNADG
jgi:predicted GTPase